MDENISLVPRSSHKLRVLTSLASLHIPALHQQHPLTATGWITNLGCRPAPKSECMCVIPKDACKLSEEPTYHPTGLTGVPHSARHESNSHNTKVLHQFHQAGEAKISNNSSLNSACLFTERWNKASRGSTWAQEQCRKISWKGS